MNQENIISCYTWDDAVNDGMNVEVTEVAKKRGFTLPVAITRNLYSEYIKATDEHNPTEENSNETNLNVINLLRSLYRAIKNQPNNDGMMIFEYKHIKMWASIEGRSLSNPEPVMTILLPEDY